MKIKLGIHSRLPILNASETLEASQGEQLLIMRYNHPKGEWGRDSLEKPKPSGREESPQSKPGR